MNLYILSYNSRNNSIQKLHLQQLSSQDIQIIELYINKIQLLNIQMKAQTEWLTRPGSLNTNSKFTKGERLIAKLTKLSPIIDQRIFERDSTLKQKKIEDIQYQLDRSLTQSQQEINVDRLNQSFQEDDEKRKLKQQVLDLQAAVKQLQQKPLDFDREITRSVVQRESLQSDFSSANQTIKQLQNKIDDLQNQLKQKNSLQIDTTNQHILDLQDRLAKLQIQCDKQVININELNQNKLAQQKEIDSLRNLINSQSLTYKQEQSENELRYSKESQVLSLNLTNKESALMTTEQKLKQTQEYLYQLQRKYDQDTLQLRTEVQDTKDQSNRFKDQLDLQSKLLEQVQNEKAQLSMMYEKLQLETNALSFQLQQQLKNGESKYLRDSTTLQQQITEKELKILEQDKQKRELENKIFSLQQKLDQDTYNFNNTIKDLQDQISRTQRSLDDKTQQFNQLLEEKQQLQNSYLQLQEEISIQKLRYQQELNKLETQQSKEVQWFQQQLNDRNQLLAELEAKIKATNDQLIAIQRRYDQEAHLNNQHSAIQDDQIKNLQDQIDQKVLQNTLLNQDKQLLNQQLDKLTQNYNDLKGQYNNDTDKLKEELQKSRNQYNDKQQAYLQLDNKCKQLSEELLQLQVRFEKEINLMNIQFQKKQQECQTLQDQLKSEQIQSYNMEQQNIILKNQVNQQMEDIRKRTEQQLTEQYQQLTNEQKAQFNLLVNSINQENQQLKYEINQKGDKIRQLENEIQNLTIGSTKNQILISELQTANQQQKFQLNEQEAKIRQLIMQDFDSMRDKSADQQIRNLMGEVKILQQKLKKNELYVQNLEDQLQKNR
ncbi:unnamed protein product (macronuclear) [Paramecium tetraurelia]|uniref:Uncharacterized protein n=1 Tax=Paramecium tetraurelia TaxID=5888 RepID=A0BEP6_PARTE|nr:uncharacterized protein GSPATT00028046001 [Paramecium tetraurelia]CAK57013.1 unnamed protein product [Paramecium tetraurelia]|eukprot:XP_001424411.1 hypothetical protein (macronuclear) [Paramecium tetraurelia strain d4-2]